jgi:peptidoglycan/LPS O-acetylase OafA/YrhL
VRPEIQALRAIAVLLVLVYHFFPSAAPGGFIGVDVFFVISGFLITSLLLREIDRTGTASATRFWARRARRLLPASLTTVLVVTVATLVFVPLNLWDQFLGDVRASTGYVQNWHLAASSVDYFAADDAPSPLQHFWSLSAEEQFYFFWPPLMLIGVILARGREPRVQRRAIAVVLGALTVASLGFGVWQTATHPATAYFGTPTRAWEFGAGGLLALWAAHESGAERWRSALSWAGLAAIVVAAFAFTKATPFPGLAALLPVLGTAAVIRAGLPQARWAPSAGFKLAPVQLVGDISYSIYLWHWPLLLLAPFILGAAAGTSVRMVLVALTLGIAWLSKVCIEDPVREGPLLLNRPPRWTFASAVAGMVLLLVLAGAGTRHLTSEVRAAERNTNTVLAEAPDCFGAAARDPRRPCRNPRLRLTVVPTPLEAKAHLRDESCKQIGQIAGKQVCAFGAAADDASRTVALLGDSHAGHWRPALEVLARQQRWRGIAIGHQGCPFSAATKALPEPARSECLRWKRGVRRWFAAHPEVTTVFASQFAGGTGVETAGGEDPFDAAVAGYAAAWTALPESVTDVVVIRDTPRARGNTDTCVEAAMARREPADRACAVPRARALDRDPAVVAAQRLGSPRVRVADLTPFLCDARRCLPVVGGVLVHKDATHLTPAFAESLAPYLLRAIARGRATVTAKAAARPRCFGAASRDPRVPCVNRRLARTVVPTPAQAKRPPKHGRCRVIGRIHGKQICEWGVPKASATTTVALVGDSHAGHWRPAFQRVAEAEGWRGVSLGHAGCPFSKATKLLPEPERSHCTEWKRQMVRWLERHPEVTIVFVSQFAGGSDVAARPGESQLRAQMRGYADAWKALPASVRHLIVIHDTPRMHGDTDTCVERAMAAHRPAGSACAVPRSFALEIDPAALAAARSRAARVDAVDLTHFFCGAARCFPVVGGALTLKDTSHMTWTFAETLAPYLRRGIDRVLRRPVTS